jgi:hypothetical protein
MRDFDVGTFIALLVGAFLGVLTVLLFIPRDRR